MLQMLDSHQHPGGLAFRGCRRGRRPHQDPATETRVELSTWGLAVAPDGG